MCNANKIQVTKDQLIAKCILWGLTPPTDKEMETEEFIPIQILGIYYPKLGTLYPWGITPSSEDKGFSH